MTQSRSRKTLELDPSFYVARANLASALLQKGDYAAAAAEYEKVHQQMPSDVSIACEVGQLYAMMWAGSTTRWPCSTR
jgi:cytochrome c-type biogenesis protein CcmH/NrfG